MFIIDKLEVDSVKLLNGIYLYPIPTELVVCWPEISKLKPLETPLQTSQADDFDRYVKKKKNAKRKYSFMV
jgi:hypothetical protein